jgi:hypothetical protein
MARFQLKDNEGNIVKDSELNIGEDDVLIMKFPDDRLPVESMTHIYNQVKNELESKKIIGLPKSIDLQVLHKV